MVCDLETGICGDAGESGIELIDLNAKAPTITLYYVTDPICSHCWALEPVLRRFEAEYGHYFKMQTVLGGMLPSWDGFADRANGIQGPADVAGHWREVGEHTRMPIDGTLWLNNPVRSSFPPSRVFKVLQKRNEETAKAFLRRAREAVFAFNRNISDDSVLMDIVGKMGLDGSAVVNEANESSSQELLEQDFAVAARLGVRGFPTIIMVNENNQGVKIVGQRSIDVYVAALQQALGTSDPLSGEPVPALKDLLVDAKLLFARELEDLYDLKPEEVQAFVQRELADGGYHMEEILGETYIQTAV